jgi:hypothetical protein
MCAYAAELTFTPEHHATLMALLAREIIEPVEAVGGPALRSREHLLRRAIWRYGTERGRRMALRARANGHPLDFLHYMAYGEWRAPEGASEVNIVERVPHLRQRVTRCPWHETWAALGLMAYGRYYCQVIDEALVHGFNPDLVLEVGDTLSNGGPCCEFTFRGANLNAGHRMHLEALREALGDEPVMPWTYHTAHLYYTVSAVIANQLGDGGRAMARRALEAFRARYGLAAADAITAHHDTDFTRLP